MFSPTKFLREYAPDFCWVSAFDLVLMAEQINEDVSEMSIRRTVSLLHLKGEFKIRSISDGTRGRKYQYLKVANA